MKGNIQESRGLWVFVEQNDGEAARVSLELLGKGRELSDKLEVNLTALLIGDSVTRLAEELIWYGADKVVLAEDAAFSDYRTEIYTRIISDQAKKDKPEVLIIGATPIGRDLAPRLAFKLETGCAADCTALDIDTENRLFLATRPAFGGNVMATIICPDHRPQMATVRPGVMPSSTMDNARTGEIIRIDTAQYRDMAEVEILETVSDEEEGVDIQEAERIVAIGMGANKEALDMLKELAGLLCAEVGASRRAVEAGWFSHDCQVGQTGKTVRPSMYIACGVSGAVQHTAGMSGSKLIIAINNDPKAEIFNVADYGCVGKITDIVPALIAEIKRRS